MQMLAKRENYSVLLPAAVATIAATVVARQLWNKKQKRGNFPSYMPIWAPNHFLTEAFLFLAVFREYPRVIFRKQRHKLGNIFYGGPIFAMGRPGDTLFLTHPDDHMAFLKKERELESTVALPDTVHAIDGENNLQILPVGDMHSFYRKIFGSILSPRALSSFLPIALSHFHEMWDELSRTKNGEVKLRLVIRETQLKIMCEILYGMRFETEKEKEEFNTLRDDFELTEAALFAPGTMSTAFKLGHAAVKRIRKNLIARFDAVLEARTREAQQHGVEQNKNNQEDPVGNAMESIVDALLKSNKASDPEALAIARDNLYLLLEASHGTTMHITTALMYFLNHPDNKRALNKVRQEVASITTPSFQALKDGMTYCDACIDETMRQATIVGRVAYHTKAGKSFMIRNQEITGPVNVVLEHSQWYDDPEVFVNPRCFLPERWLRDGNEHEMSSFARRVFNPFGSGRHICLGLNLAKIVMKANLYAFASNPCREIEYDTENVKVVDDIFPEKKVSDDFPCRVVVVKQ